MKTLRTIVLFITVQMSAWSLAFAAGSPLSAQGSDGASCIPVGCHGPVKSCQSYSNTDDRPSCDTQFKDGDSACRLLSRCEVVKGQCGVFQLPKAQECFSCYEQCNHNPDKTREAFPLNSSDDWNQCFRQCAAKAGFDP